MLFLVNLIASGYAWKIADILFEQNKFILGWICIFISALNFAVALSMIN